MSDGARRIVPAALKGVAQGARPIGEFHWGDPGPGYWKVLLAVNERRLAALGVGRGPFWTCNYAIRAAEWEHLTQAICAVREKMGGRVK